jgi:hypothetical protein
MSIREWPAALQAAGVRVVVHPEVGWLGHGALRDHNIVWHHDASPPGDSPGALRWMKSNFKVSSAQIWVDRYGTWHFISYGIAWHAGRVNDNRFDNYRSVGIETDHTTGEEWPSALLASLRKGTAVVLRHEGKGVDSLAFHKTICVPPGRKSDPDGLSLSVERNAVQAYVNNEAHFDVVGEEDELNQTEKNQLKTVYDFITEQERAPQGWSYSAQAASDAREVKGIVEDIRKQLQVPGAPYAWLPALNDKLDALAVQVGAVEAIKADGGVDVKALAEKLGEILPEAVKKSLGEALVG